MKTEIAEPLPRDRAVTPTWIVDPGAVRGTRYQIFWFVRPAS